MPNENLRLLQNAINQIMQLGWIDGHRPGNNGSVGNTLEDLLGIPENNLQLPDFGEWELKSRRNNTTSLLTLFHGEPEPRNRRIVPRILLPQFGWSLIHPGNDYPTDERSFRATLTTTFSDRGFIVKIDRRAQKVSIHFNSNRVDTRHASWLQTINNSRGLNDFTDPPYWTFEFLENKLHTKLHNLVFVGAETRTHSGVEQLRYTNISVFVQPTLERLLTLLANGNLYIDFDARTGHNHGTKFRINPQYLSQLFDYSL